MAFVACSWCGVSSGRRGVTLKKIGDPKKPAGMLCSPCMEEFKTFGHRIAFRHWLRLYWRHWWFQMRILLAVRRHSREIRLQYRFRAKGVPVRA